MCARQHKVAEVACNRLDGPLMGCIDPRMWGRVGAPYQCPRDTHNRIGWEKLSLASETSLSSIRSMFSAAPAPSHSCRQYAYPCCVHSSILSSAYTQKRHQKETKVEYRVKKERNILRKERKRYKNVYRAKDERGRC